MYSNFNYSQNYSALRHKINQDRSFPHSLPFKCLLWVVTEVELACKRKMERRESARDQVRITFPFKLDVNRGDEVCKCYLILTSVLEFSPQVHEGRTFQMESWGQSKEGKKKVNGDRGLLGFGKAGCIIRWKLHCWWKKWRQIQTTEKNWFSIYANVQRIPFRNGTQITFCCNPSIVISYVGFPCHWFLPGSFSP